MFENPALQPAGVLHADRDAGEQALENARRREIEGRPDLAQIVRDRLLAFRAVHAEAGNVALRVIEVVIADPGERQVGKYAVTFRQTVEADGIGRRIDGIDRLDHHAFRTTRRARRVQHHRDIVAARLANSVFPPGSEVGLGFQQSFAIRLNEGKIVQMLVVVVAQPTRFVVDHLRQRGNFRGEGLDLVDLLLILNDGEAHFGVIEDVSHLFGDRVGVNRHRHRPQ